MAWNGSNIQNSKTDKRCEWPIRHQKSTKSSKPVIRYVILTLTAILSFAYWFISYQKQDQNSSKRKSTATKAVARRNKVPTGKPIHLSKRKPKATKSIKLPELTDGNPIVKQKALGRVVQWKHRGAAPLFTNRFESLVCEIMTATPGERFLDLDIEDEFDEAFAESLSHQITINPEDTEDVRYMKETVINAKNEVRQLVQEGNSARDIILNARDELNKIADYRDQLQETVNEYLVTASDVKETLRFVNEANQILAEYGALPVDGPDDEDTAYELMIHAKEEKIKKLDEQELKSKKE